MSDTLTRDRATLRMELEQLAEQADVIAERTFAIADMPVPAHVSQLAGDVARTNRLIQSLATIVAALEGGE